MKALKEKRINLRSLWRRSLVILSLLALVFAACGDSDDGGDPSNGVTVPTPSFRAAWLESFPFVPQEDGKWGAFEGTPVNLQGTVVVIEDNNGNRVRITDTNHLSIFPPVYMFNAQNADWPPTFAGVDGQRTGRTTGLDHHILTFTYGRSSTTFKIANGMAPTTAYPNGAIGYVEPLINVVHDGWVRTQDYYVDDDPMKVGNNLAGITLQGEYGDWSPANAYWTTRDLTSYIPLYPWRWVWNNVENFEDQMPGVLLNVGSWGIMSADTLTGRRIPVRNLYQVDTVEWVSEPTFSKDLYYDDWKYFGHPSEGFSIQNWVNEKDGILAGTAIRVRYAGRVGDPPPTAREFPASRFDSIVYEPYYAWSEANIRTGIWTQANQKLIQSGLWDHPHLRFPAHARNLDQDPIVAMDDGLDMATVNTYWSNWMRREEFQNLVIEYRKVRSAPVKVRFYNTFTGLTVESGPGVSTPLVMNGDPLVDHRMDKEPEFFQKVVVRAFYTENISQQQNAGRDILYDLSQGHSRAIVSTNVEVDNAAGTARVINDAIFNDRNSANWVNAQATRVVRVTMQTFDPNARRTQQRVDVEVGQVNYPPRGN